MAIYLIYLTIYLIYPILLYSTISTIYLIYLTIYLYYHLSLLPSILSHYSISTTIYLYYHLYYLTTICSTTISLHLRGALGGTPRVPGRSPGGSSEGLQWGPTASRRASRSEKQHFSSNALNLRELRKIGKNGPKYMLDTPETDTGFVQTALSYYRNAFLFSPRPYQRASGTS